MKTICKIIHATTLMSTLMLVEMRTAHANDFSNAMNSDAETVILSAKEEAPELTEVAPEVELVNEDNYGRLTFSIMPSFMSVDGTQKSNNSHGELNSNMYLSLRAEYEHVFHSWVIGISSGFGKVIFEKSDDHVLLNEKQGLLDLDLSLGRKFKRFTFGAGAGQDNKIFYKAMNATFVDVEKRTVQRIYLQTSYEVIKGLENSVTASGRYGINPASDTQTYDVENGITYSAEVKWTHYYSQEKSIGLKFYYNNDEYKTQKLDLNSSEVGVGVSFGFDWGTGQ